jgi:8-oxo-dGTP diphosphatase
MTIKELFPLVLADIALFTVEDRQLKVLLVQRKEDPAAGKWALPGGILKPDIDRSLEDTATRVLRSKTGVAVPHLEQVATFSGPDRDPRGWSVSSLYYALLPRDRIAAVNGDKTEAIEWCDAHKPGHRCAFDHALLLRTAVTRLQDKVARSALPLHLLAAQFTLTDLQQACEAILSRELDKSVFRRRIKDDPALVPLVGEFLRGPQRPAQLYQARASFHF